jgi:protein-disulfide isomerase
MPERAWECVVGEPTAPIKLEVFSDFECPACRQFYLDTVRPLMADYGATGQVCVVYREFPLRMHKHARQAALYALAASRLGRTQWVQVTDQLYFYQGTWAANGQLLPALEKALTPAEVESVRLWATDKRLEEEVDRDLADGAARGVRSTPTSFITSRQGTERVSGVVQYQIMRRYLDRLLQQP